MQGQQIRSLVVFANPQGTSHLRLGTEERAIREAIRLSRNRDSISITTCHAATVHDLRRALLDEQFEIVHISGHGTERGLVLENELGNPFLVPPQALADLLQAYPSIRCVLLNACYSHAQGQLISMGVPFTISMDGAISDNAAIEFTRGFYDAIGAGRAVEFAYDEGWRTVKLAAPGAAFHAEIIRLTEVVPEVASPAPSTAPSDCVSSEDELAVPRDLQVLFPNTVNCSASVRAHKVQIGRFELKNMSHKPVRAGWRLKVVLLRPIGYRVTLADSIILPSMAPQSVVPAGPFTITLPTDVGASKDTWHIELSSHPTPDQKKEKSQEAKRH